MKNFLLSKTIWGGVLLGLPQILDTLSSGLLGPKVQGIAQGVGIILASVGVRHAITKRG